MVKKFRFQPKALRHVHTLSNTFSNF
jgi:hypothetical protein